MTDFKVKAPNKQKIWVTLLMTATAIVAVLGNIFVTMALDSDKMGYSNDDETVWSFFAGFLIAQTCLIAVWCSLGAQRASVRIPLSLGIQFGLGCAYLGTLASTDVSMASLEMPTMFLISQTVLLILVQTPLWVLRFKKNLVLGLKQSVDGADDHRQFGIKDLLLLMAIVAAGVVLIRDLVPLNLPAGQSTQDFWKFVNSLLTEFPKLLTIELLTATLTLLSFGVVFSTRDRTGIGILLGVAVFFGTLCAMAVLMWQFNDWSADSSFQLLTNLLPYTFTLIWTLLMAFVIFYRAGIRLRPN